MMPNRFALSNLFSEIELNRIQKTLRELAYFEIKMSSFGTDCFYLARIEEWITDRLTLKGYKSVQCFARLNTEKHDTSFRIHADSCSLDDSGKLFYPEVACVFYPFSTPGYGTGLFRHPRWGDRCPINHSFAFTYDDGKWEMYDYCDGIENTSFVYPANLYHSRVPNKSFGKSKKDGRIVIVNFMSRQ